MNGPIEPSSDIRQWARCIRELYVGLIAEGFTEKQALRIVIRMFKQGGGS